MQHIIVVLATAGGLGSATYTGPINKGPNNSGRSRIQVTTKSDALEDRLDAAAYNAIINVEFVLAEQKYAALVAIRQGSGAPADKVANALLSLGFAQQINDRLLQAEATHRAAYAIFRKFEARPADGTARAAYQLAQCLVPLGKYREAESLYRVYYDAESKSDDARVKLLVKLAYLYSDAGRREDTTACAVTAAPDPFARDASSRAFECYRRSGEACVRDGNWTTRGRRSGWPQWPIPGRWITSTGRGARTSWRVASLKRRRSVSPSSSKWAKRGRAQCGRTRPLRRFTWAWRPSAWARRTRAAG